MTRPYEASRCTGCCSTPAAWPPRAPTMLHAAGTSWPRPGGVAGRLGRDANHLWTAVGPTNVAMHRAQQTELRARQPGRAASRRVMPERSTLTQVTANSLPTSATPRMAAGALFVDEAGRPLLVKPTYKDGWDLPGGYVEPGESPLAACRREVAEELGIFPTIGALLIVDWAPNEREGDKLLFVFDGGTLNDALLQSIRLPHE